MEITVIFRTEETDLDIFQSALEYGLEKAGTKAKIISMSKSKEE